MIVYKVVNKDMRSAIVSNSLSLQYKIGKITAPRIGGSLILAFHNFDDAKVFAQSLTGEFSILQCEANIENSFANILLHPFTLMSSSYTRISDFWMSSNKNDWDDRMTAPIGTIGCSSLMPIIRVWKTGQC